MNNSRVTNGTVPFDRDDLMELRRCLGVKGTEVLERVLASIYADREEENRQVREALGHLDDRMRQVEEPRRQDGAAQCANVLVEGPGAVQPLSDTTISFWLTDDEGELVERPQPFEVSVQGSGGTVAPQQGVARNGRGTFSFLAPVAETVSTVVVRVGEESMQVVASVDVQTSESWAA